MEYLMDPEYLFEFCEIPLGAQLGEGTYDFLWQYFLDNCYLYAMDEEKANKLSMEIEEKTNEIKSKRKGFCSITDLKSAGYCCNGQFPCGKIITLSMLQKILKDSGHKIFIEVKVIEEWK